MKLFKYILNCVLISIVMISCKKNFVPEYSLSFDKTSNLFLDEVNQSKLFVNESYFPAEGVIGVVENALRVNGYYGYAKGSCELKNSNSFTISTWLAPGSYPAHDIEISSNEILIAGVISLFNEFGNQTLVLGVDHFGRPAVRLRLKEKLVIMHGENPIELNKWSRIAVAVNGKSNQLSLSLNGEIINIQPVTELNLKSFNHIVIGKGIRNERIAGFSNNVFNGAIDEVNIYPVYNEDLLTNYDFKDYTLQKADLHVPVNRYIADHNRPRFHAMPEWGWTNESHGLVVLDGKYQLFNQKNGNGPYWGHINWGRLESDDLVQWFEKPIVLFPEQGVDELGIWSGHVAVKDRQPYLFYTSGKENEVNISLTNYTGNKWIKYQDNPIIHNPDTTSSTSTFRDPFVFSENGTWYMIVGAETKDKNNGALRFYKSTNEQFTQWKQLDDLFVGNSAIDDTGHFFEMPVYYNFGKKSLLLINRLPKPKGSQFWLGEMKYDKFIPDQLKANYLDAVPYLLSPTIGKDNEGNLIAIGIIPDEVSIDVHRKQGWAHVLSFPRVWELNQEEKLIQKPHPNLLKLRSKSFDWKENTEGIEQNLRFSEIVFKSVSTGEYNGKIGCKLYTELDEEILIYYDIKEQRFFVNRTKSSLLDGAPKDVKSGSKIFVGKEMNWRIFIDGSMIEIFINDELAFGTRMFTKGKDINICLIGEKQKLKVTNQLVYLFDKNLTSHKN